MFTGENGKGEAWQRARSASPIRMRFNCAYAISSKTSCPRPSRAWPCPSTRSRTGNHFAITFAAPGQLPASPRPSRKRKMLSDPRPRANACAIAAADQGVIEKASMLLLRVEMVC